jgi:dTDP-4-dehydrorhamnose reductase
MKLNVLVTGGDGQLANNIKDIADHYTKLNFIFKNSQDLDITKIEDIKTLYNSQKIDYCINCAAYTAVDKAENESEKAHKINELGVKNLSIVSAENNTILIHVSTDFVFDGTKSTAYLETDPTNPKGVYGVSKLYGENAIQEHIKKYFILRTSWLYSEYNTNFMTTMLRLAQTKKELSVVDDQIGTPTYAKDLASTLLHIIDKECKDFGLYHYSNEGVASWYDFAQAIFKESDNRIKVSPIKSKDYPTPAKRPNFSVLDKSKIKKVLKIEIPYWRDSLVLALSRVAKTNRNVFDKK